MTVTYVNKGQSLYSLTGTPVPHYPHFLTLRLLMSYIYGAPSKARNANVIYRVSQEERTKLREGVPYVKLYRYNPKHRYPKLNGFRDNGK